VTARVVPAGDAMFLVEYAEVVDHAVNARVMALAARVRAARIRGLRDVVPTYRSVAIYFEPLKTDQVALRSLLEQEAEAVVPAVDFAPAEVRIPVCYDADLGPDLQEIAEQAHLTADEVVRLHAARTYRVFMLGFAPGFAYLGVVDPRIVAPRLSTPRLRVPAGSVGIAGEQTGIYPMETPGGWRLIGRTPLKPFDPRRPTPFLLGPGDAVRFYPIERRTFDRWPPAVSAT
jgi:inhibitor of KinA